MSEFKGTKGKWFVQGDPFLDKEDGIYYGSYDIITENREQQIVSIPAYQFWGQTLETAKANALLISKSPEMLECLQSLENDNNAIPKFMWDRIQSLIKQATDL